MTNPKGTLVNAPIVLHQADTNRIGRLNVRLKKELYRDLGAYRLCLDSGERTPFFPTLDKFNDFEAFNLKFVRGVGTVRWRGLSEVTANQALRETAPATAVEKGSLLLRALLAYGAEIAVGDVLKEA